MSNKAKQMLFFLVLLASIASFYIATIRSGQGWTEDSALYAQHAKNISNGEPYGKIDFVYDARRYNVGPRAYPPGYPLILAAVYRWRGLDFTLIKMETIGFFLLTLILVFYAFSLELEFWDRLALIAIVGFNPLFWGYKDAVLSDIPFLFFAYAALFLLEWSWAHEEQLRYSSVLRGGVVGLALYIAYAIRIVGIVLVPTAIVLSLIRAKKLTRATWIAVGVSLSLCGVQSVLIGDLSSYLGAAGSSRGSLIGRVPATIHYYLGVSSTLWDNGHSKTARLVVFAILCAFGTIGLLVQLRRRVRAWEIFAAMYVLLLFIWEEDRYLFPLIPLFVFYFLKGIEWLGARKGSKFQAGLTALIVVAIALTYTGEYAVVDLRHVPSNGMDGAQAQQLFQFIAHNVSEHDIVEFPEARTLAFYTGRHTFQYLPLGAVSDSQIWSDLQAVGVTYVTSYSFEESFWARFMRSNQPCLDEVFSNFEFQLYRIRKTSVPGQGPCRTWGP